MKTYDESRIKVLDETEHYARIFHPAMQGMTVTESIHFLLQIAGSRFHGGRPLIGLDDPQDAPHDLDAIGQ